MKKVLIVAKKSAYQTYFNEYQHQSLKKLIRKGDAALLRIRRSHDTHYKTLEDIRQFLKKRNVSVHVLFRGEKFDSKKYDLVISVGGDGSFLEASHQLEKGLILGVNSDTSHSVGKLCPANRSNFEYYFNQIQKGHFKIQSLHRMEVRLNRKKLAFYVLNDILVTHLCPAAMSHYTIQIGSVAEKQRSSGVWISTAAGSTAAMHSAGGRPMLQTSKALQYLPRELFQGHGQDYRLQGGILPPGKKLTLVSQMQEGMLYLDGAHHTMPFGYGDRLEVSDGVPLHSVFIA